MLVALKTRMNSSRTKVTVLNIFLAIAATVFGWATWFSVFLLLTNVQITIIQTITVFFSPMFYGWFVVGLLSILYFVIISKIFRGKGELRNGKS